MDISNVLPSVVGIFNLTLVGIIIYFAESNARVLKDVKTQHLFVAAVVMFMLTGLLYPVLVTRPEFQPILKRATYVIFVCGFALLLLGSTTSLTRAWKFAKGIKILKLPHIPFRLAAMLVFLLLVFPLWSYSLVAQTKLGVSNWGAMISVSVFFLLLLIGEKRLHSSIKPTAIVTGISDDKLLREDLRCFRAYLDLTNRFSAVITTSVTPEFLKETLNFVKEKHEVMKDWEYSKQGFLKNTEKSVEKLSQTNEKKSFNLISSAFGALNSALIKLYSSITSPALAKRTFENIYTIVRKGYTSLQPFPQITVHLPTDILDEERVKHARREELEKLVRAKTVELRKTITELQRVEWGLHVAEKRFRGAVGLLPTPYVETDRNGQITFINPAGYEIFGLSVRDLDRNLALKDLAVQKDKERIENDLKTAISQRKVVSGEYQLLKKNGKNFPALLRAAPIIYADNPVGLRCILLDISDREHAREAQRKGIIKVLQKLKESSERRATTMQLPDRIRRLQMETVDLIRRELQKPIKSPIVEAYKELLGPPLRRIQRKKKKKRA